MNRSLPTLLSFALLAAACAEEKKAPAAPPPASEVAATQTPPPTDSFVEFMEAPEAGEFPEVATAAEESEADAKAVAEDAKATEPKDSAQAGEKAVVAKPKPQPVLMGDLGSRTVEGAIGFGGLGISGTGKGGGGIATGYGRGAGRHGTAKLTTRTARGATVGGYPYQGEPVVRSTSGEGYTNHGTNPFTDPLEDRFSTFAIDVDTGSYTIARRKLQEGGLPPKDSVRVEEFVNYFDYSYPKPKSGAFAVSMEAAPSPFATSNDTYLLRVGVQGQTIDDSKRRPVHLTFLVDVSGSMQSPDKIGLVKKSLGILADNLREEDTVAIATYAGATQVLLQPTRAADRTRILDAIEKLSAGGSTAMESGLNLAYGLADKNLEPAHENRVIVLSDGDANVGRTGWKELLGQISTHVKKGITLSTIGFGMGNYKDSRMEQLANHGNGNYYYVDSEKEAQKIFGDQLDGTLQVIAKDVKLQVEFNPEAVQRYRLIGYENRDIADKDFRNDKVDAGEIGAGHTVTAMYEIVLHDELPERIATVRVRHKEPRGSDKATEAKFGLDRDDLHTKIAASSKDFQFAASVCAFAEKLRASEYAKQVTWDWIEEIAASATANRSDRKEMVSLIRKARKQS